MIYRKLASLIFGFCLGAAALSAISVAPAERVVVLGSGLTEIFFHLGHEDHVVGRSRYATFPEAARVVTSVGGMTDPNIETLLNLEPDLILINHLAAQDENVARLRSLGIPVRIAPMETLEDLFAATRLIGRLAGDPDGAEAVAREWESRLASVRNGAGAVDGAILLLYDAVELYAAGDGSFPGDLIEAVGLRNVAAPAPSAWPQLTKEAVLDDVPDIVILASSTASALRRNRNTLAAIEAGKDPFWKLAFQVKRPRFVLADPGLFVVNGPRTLDALELLVDASLSRRAAD